MAAAFVAATLDLALIALVVCGTDGGPRVPADGPTVEVQLLRPAAPLRRRAVPGPPPAMETAAVSPGQMPPPRDGPTAEDASASAPSGPSGADLRRVLARVSRCAAGDLDRLSEDERRDCDARLAAVARQAPVIDAIPQDKRRTFNAVVAAYCLRHAPTPVATGGVAGLSDRRPDGPTPGGERWQAPEGTHLPSLRCSVPLGPVRKDRKVRPPPHSLVLGPCTLRPGVGVLTEEADIP